MPATTNVPIAICSGIICFLVGLGGGAASMVAFGYKTERPNETAANPEGGGPGPSAMMPGGGGGGGRGGPGGPGGGGRGPTSKTQLAALVGKLNQLTDKPLFVELTPAQKKQIHEQLQGLADKDELSDDDAKKRLDAMLDVLKDQKATMEAAGYRWPGQGGGGPGGGGGGGGGGRPGGGGMPAPPGVATGPTGALGGGPGGGGPANPFKTEANASALKSLDAHMSK
jgi:hypothetical protein